MNLTLMNIIYLHLAIFCLNVAVSMYFIKRSKRTRFDADSLTNTEKAKIGAECALVFWVHANKEESICIKAEGSDHFVFLGRHADLVLVNQDDK